MIRMNALTPAPTADDASLRDSNAACSEIQKARQLVEQLHAAGRQSTSEMLHQLRRAFPHSPLAVRVRALEALRRS
jgi:hypothetical protein